MSQFNDVPKDSAARLIAELAEKSVEPHLVGIATDGLGEGLPPKVPALYDPKNSQLTSIKRLIEEQRLRPQRRKGTAKVDTLEAFIDLTNRHKDDGSVIFGRAVWPGPSLMSVLDYHEVEGTPRHGEHRVVYEFPLTEEFKAWVEGHGKLMTQEDFAFFLEEHSAELTAPNDKEKNDFERLFGERVAIPSELVALARHLEIHVNSTVKSATRLQSGERSIEFTEDHVNGRGEKVDIPGFFMIAVPAFISGAAVRIPARLRYRTQGGNLVFFYQLYRWQEWLREQVQLDLLEAGRKTELPTFEGAPEAAA